MHCYLGVSVARDQKVTQWLAESPLTGLDVSLLSQISIMPLNYFLQLILFAHAPLWNRIWTNGLWTGRRELGTWDTPAIWDHEYTLNSWQGVSFWSNMQEAPRSDHHAQGRRWKAQAMQPQVATDAEILCWGNYTRKYRLDPSSWGYRCTDDAANGTAWFQARRVADIHTLIDRNSRTAPR